MLDFGPVRKKEMTYADLVADLTIHDLRDLSNEMIDGQLEMIGDCTDADVIFEPDDPDANDTYVVVPGEEALAWNLGHLIVHVTASSEESAFLAAELARGVEMEPRRSRSEVHWSAMKTIAQCRERLEESRRMRLACLDVWPDDAHLDNYYESSFSKSKITPVLNFVYGLSHGDSHLAQIEEVVRQAKVARS